LIIIFGLRKWRERGRERERGVFVDEFKFCFDNDKLKAYGKHHPF
jgi:hypothetical protein